MTRVFINLALNKLRQGRNKYYHVEFESKHESGISEADEEIEAVDPKVVLKAVQELPEIYRIVINMYAIDGLSHREISDALGITEGSSKSRLSRARALLGQKLKSE
jgi:RNA polymerase sigma-70 factor (ECF subfamily)